jgi:hypothetical protein
MRRIATLPLLLGLAALLAGGMSPAGDKKKGEAPDEKAIAEAIMKAAEPGEPHKKLEALAGSWEGALKMWLDPSKSPAESKGTSESKMILGGRYLVRRSRTSWSFT